MHLQLLKNWHSAHTVLMCVVYISEQTATSALYVGCPESIRPFWISREPVACCCNLAARQRRPYCAFMSSHSPVGLVGRQWDAIDWSCVLCDHRIHDDWASRSSSSRQCTCMSYSSRAGFFGQSITSPRSVSLPTARIWLPVTSGFSQSQNHRLKWGDMWMRLSHST
jgi:hypothetical protein